MTFGDGNVISKRNLLAFTHKVELETKIIKLTTAKQSPDNMKKKKQKIEEENELLLEVLFEENEGNELATIQDYAFIQRSFNILDTRSILSKNQKSRKPTAYINAFDNLLDLALHEQANQVNPYA